LRRALAAVDCSAILLYDAINMRYATDVPNMQTWATQNPWLNSR
jgi:hypothetical protein